MSRAIEEAQPTASAGMATPQSDWELDYYSRPILEADGKKRWERLTHKKPLLC